MAQDPEPPWTGAWLLRLPWVLATAGLIVMQLAFLLPLGAGLRAALLALGTLTVGVGIERHFRSATWDLLGRLETAGLLGGGTLAAALGWFASARDWDSARMFFGVAVLVSSGGAILVLLPTPARRGAIT